MKAAIIEKFGPPEVLKIKEIDKPVPNENQVLVKMKATSVNAADCNMRGFTYIPPGLGLLAKLMLGFKKPKFEVIGSVVAGEVEEVGNKVKEFKIGDRIYGSNPELGSYAEFVCVSGKGLYSFIPDNISFEEAAVIPYGALTALYFLHDKANVRRGQKVLINGASGGVGVYAVQLANYYGADVTGVCSTGNIEFVKSLGANRVIDYTKEDFTANDQKWDIIFDIVVGKTSFSKYKKSINPKGYYLAVAGGLGDLIQMIWTSVVGGKKVVFGGGSDCEKVENLELLNKLLKEGSLKPIVDRSFSFDQMVNAHSYVEDGNKIANIAVIM